MKAILYILLLIAVVFMDFALWVAMGYSRVGVVIAVAFGFGAFTQFLMHKSHDDYQEGYRDGYEGAMNI